MGQSIKLAPYPFVMPTIWRRNLAPPNKTSRASAPVRPSPRSGPVEKHKIVSIMMPINHKMYIDLSSNLKVRSLSVFHVGTPYTRNELAQLVYVSALITIIFYWNPLLVASSNVLLKNLQYQYSPIDTIVFDNLNISLRNLDTKMNNKSISHYHQLIEITFSEIKCFQLATIHQMVGTYSSPEHDVQTNEPMVTFTYVGPLW
ncbi:hypothetical protein AGLY_006784 [Aphis glycines]|uniref:Uncharacterized protein n=1 Tax=Aphis glycines TaxID=307491 RepID=A0A6G0TSK2_APHGL|nr:hypothetical protein AGLY_006784 [Aphis glycines]